MNRIAATYVYPLDGHAPIRNGFVEYRPDGTVMAVGTSPDIAAEPCFFDGAVVPGFVNTHCHAELSYMRGLFRRGTGMAGFIDQINALRDTCSREERIASIRHWMDVMWHRGVTAMADISNGPDSFAVKQASPMYTRTFLEVFGTEPEDCADVIASVRSLECEARSFGLDAAPTPHACYTMSPELLSAASAEGLRSGFLSYHSEETPQEEEMLRSGSGPMWENRRAAGMSVPPVTGASSLRYFLDRLQAVHPFPVEENVLLVHEVCLEQDGIDALKEALLHPFIALCPLSNLYIHDALPPVPLMRANGLTLTVGTDSLSSNDDLDIVAELRCLQQHFPVLELDELLHWACLNGARFLKKDTVFGSLAPGKRPGIVRIGGLDASGRLTDESYSERVI